jgi:hypothetical protein
MSNLSLTKALPNMAELARELTFIIPDLTDVLMQNLVLYCSDNKQAFIRFNKAMIGLWIDENFDQSHTKRRKHALQSRSTRLIFSYSLSTYTITVSRDSKKKIFRVTVFIPAESKLNLEELLITATSYSWDHQTVNRLGTPV